MYYLEIITDGEDPKNTFVRLDGKLFKGIQSLSFKADYRETIVMCNIGFVPMGNLEYDPEMEYKLSQLKNKLEILSNGFSKDTIIKLNGKPLKLKTFSMDVNLNQININALDYEDKWERRNLKFNDLKKY